jgi:hypothetical protein
VGLQHCPYSFINTQVWVKLLFKKKGLGSYFWEIKKYFVRREVPRYFILEGKLEAQKGGMIS